MLLYFDIDRKLLLRSPGGGDELTAISAVRGEEEEVSIQVLQDNAPVELAAPAEMKIVIKEVGHYDEDPLVEVTDFTYDETSKIHRGEVNWNIDVLNEMFGIQSDTPVDISGGVAATNVITTSSPHLLSVGQRFYFPSLTGGTGLESGTTSDIQRYYVLTAPTGSTLTCAMTAGGAVVDFTTDITDGTVCADPVDVASITLAMQAAHRADGTAGWKRSINAPTLTLDNDYLRDDDGAASAAAVNARETWLSDRAVRYDEVQSLSAPEITQGLDNLGISAFVQTLLNDAAAANFLTTLGVSAFIQTLLDDAAAGNALTTLGVSAYVQTLLDDANAAAFKVTLGGVIPRRYLSGLKLSNNGSDATNDIDIAVGAARDSTDAADILFASALTKRLDAGWAAGTNQGMRNSAVAIANTTYHIYLVSKALGADPDIYAHTSTTVATVITALQAETGGSSYTLARRIGSIVRAGAAILPFIQDGDEFMLVTPVLDVSVTNLTTSRSTYALASMPTGLRMQSRIRATTTHAAANAIWVGDLSETDAAPSVTASPLANMINQVGSVSDGKDLAIMTDTSAQIGARSLASSTTLRIVTRGWLDRRGRDD